MDTLEISLFRGLIFNLFVGTIFHFTYFITHNKLVGYFSSTSKSLWEHMKTAVLPMIIYWCFMKYAYSSSFNNMAFALGVAIIVYISFSVLITKLYLIPYNRRLSSMDCLIYIFSIICSYNCMGFLFTLDSFHFSFEMIGVFIAISITIAFLRLSFNPLDTWIFRSSNIKR